MALSIASGNNQGQAYSEATGYDGDYASQQATQYLQSRPEIRALVDEIRAYDASLITDDLLRGATLKEMLHAEHSRDRQSAARTLMQTRGMLRDVIEHTTHEMSDTEYLDRLEREFGKEARDRAAEELGLA
jgi:hypothetical protein